MADRLADLADDLYGTAPAAFVAARGALVARLDDKALAARVKELRKPSPAAWVVNLLVRERRGELDAVLDLGVALRAAQESLDRAELTRLAKERRARVTALAQTGADLAREEGHPVPPAVATAVAATLDAGLADAGAADAIRTGRLLRALETIGFEPVDLAEAVAVPEAGSRAAQKRPAAERPRPRAVDDADAEQRLARDRADAVVARTETDEEDAEAALDDADERLRAARKALLAAEREVSARETARDAAADAHARAAAAAETARSKRRALG